MKLFVLAPLLILSLYAHSAPTADTQKTETKRQFIYENDSIKSWKSTITPDTPLKLHRHDFPRLVTVLKGGILESQTESGKVLHRRVFKEGESYWLEADPAGEYHYCVNVGNTIIEVVVVEVKN